MESRAELDNDITDHYTENNVAVQDHIANRPKRITLRGYVGELIYSVDGKDSPSFLQTLTQGLTVVDSYLPQLTDGAQQLKDVIDGNDSDLSFNNLLSDSTNIYALVQNLNPPIPKQQQAYLYFKALRDAKILMSLQTPFEFTTNMAIERLLAKQDAETKYITDFSITLKEIRQVSTITQPFDYAQQISNVAGALAQQASPTNSLGNVQGSESDLTTDEMVDDAFTGDFD